MKATVISIYFKNVRQEVVDAQRKCVERFLPKDWTFRQYLHENLGESPHAEALEKCINESSDDVIVILDIDCVPLSSAGFLTMYGYAAQCFLIGAVQRANHLHNNSHLYVAPSCMAFSKKTYKAVDSPGFAETMRGDVGEELTYRWEERGAHVKFLWPTSVEHALWVLDVSHMFGIGTTYENMFFHSFNIRDKNTQDYFIKKCEELLK